MNDLSLDDLLPGTPVRLSVTLSSGGKRVLEGIIRNREDARILVSMQWEELNWKALQLDATWTLVHELKDCILTHEVRFIEFLQDQAMLLEVSVSTCFNSSRRAERVEAEVLLRDWPLGAGWSRLRKAGRQKVVLSRNGILFKTEVPLKCGHEIGLEIFLPGKLQQPLQVAGHVVHTTPKGKNQHEVAVAFSSISQEDQDLIDTLFLTHHFRKMHDRVRLLGSVLSPSLNDPKKNGDPSENT